MIMHIAHIYQTKTLFIYLFCNVRTRKGPLGPKNSEY